MDGESRGQVEITKAALLIAASAPSSPCIHHLLQHLHTEDSTECQRCLGRFESTKDFDSKDKRFIGKS